MKRFLLIVYLTLSVILPTYSQYYSVNFDVNTVAAMTAAFNTEAATEMYYAEQLANIRKSYQAAEVAAAGIFASKYLDRKALTDVGLLPTVLVSVVAKRYHLVVDVVELSIEAVVPLNRIVSINDLYPTAV